MVASGLWTAGCADAPDDDGGVEVTDSGNGGAGDGVAGRGNDADAEADAAASSADAGSDGNVATDGGDHRGDGDSGDSGATDGGATDGDATDGDATDDSTKDTDNDGSDDGGDDGDLIDVGPADADVAASPDVAAGDVGGSGDSSGGDGDGDTADAGLPAELTGCAAAAPLSLGPAWPASTTKLPAPPSTACAKPGWPGTAAPSPLVWTEATASFGLPTLPLIGDCLLPHDFDADGDVDLAFVAVNTVPGSKIALWWLRKEASGYAKAVLTLPTALPVRGCVAADLDSDGDDDVVLVGEGGLFWVRNDGASASVSTLQVDHAFQLGLHGIAALDADRDGDLDLVLAEVKASKESKDWSQPCICKKAANPPYTECKGGFCSPLHHHLWLLRNDGGGKLSWQGGLPDIAGDLWSFSVADPDRDGWQDVFVGNEWGQHGWLRHNPNSGGWQALTTALGLLPYAHVMGSVVADLDLDGADDLFIADYGVDTGYRLLPGQGYVNASDGWGLWKSWLTKVSWAVAGADFDSDGWVDLFVSNSGVMTDASFWTVVKGDDFVGVPDAGHQSWQNKGPGFAVQTVPHPAKIPVAVEPTRLAVADLDGDGDLDILDVPLGFALRVLRNDTPQGGWLRVRLVGSSSPRAGEGAWVEVWADGHVQRRNWTHSAGHNTWGTGIAHFGLGSATPSVLRVWWPSGKVSTIAQPALGMTHVVVEPKATP